MRILYPFILFVFLSVEFFSQCDGDRYKTQIFDDYTLSSDILYGQNYSFQGELQDLFLDVYEPEGDLEAERALIIIAHGGFFITGSKTGEDVVPFAEDFAKMGYVVASIGYRLGMEGDPILPSEQTSTEAVVRGIHDGKAAIRFFRKSIVEDGNPYRLNSDLFFSAGVSAGGFITVHSLYLDELDEIPEIVDTTKLGLGGGVEGLSGHLQYSSQLVAGVNIAGAVSDTAIIDNNEEALISFHGNLDNVVPYDVGIISLVGLELAEAMGSFPIHTKLDQLGIENCLVTQDGEAHVPHVGNELLYDTLVVKTRNFLASFVCDLDLNCEYEDIATNTFEAFDAKIKIYPNPSSDMMRVEFPYGDYSYEVCDLTGRVVERRFVNQSGTINLYRSILGKGIFVLNIIGENGQSSRKIAMH